MILGIWDGHDAGAALVDPAAGRILCAVNEERLTRRKLEVGFPEKSIAACLEAAGLAPGDVETVAFSTTDVAKTLTRYVPRLKEGYYQLRRRKVRPGRLDPLKRAFKYTVTTWRPNALSRRLSESAVRRELARVGLSKPRVEIVPHHMAHAATAAYTSGLSRALVVTLDGVGDGLSGTLSRFADGKLELVELLRARDSLGIFYEFVTNLLNMRELEDEGKVMALASYGYSPSDGANPLLDLFEVAGTKIRCRLGPRGLRRFLASELQMVPSEQFAWMAQKTLETHATTLVRNALRATGERRLAFAGGVASNIQLNMRLAELDECEAFYVFPHMGDGGLALGAALAAAVASGASPCFGLGDLRLGPPVSCEEVDGALSGSALRFERLESPAAEAARRLAGGQIVFWFQGRMEFGPRALGGRSILGRPDRPELRDRLNLRLKRRVWYQPFCPSILDEEAARLLEGGEVPNRYMTLAYRVRPEGRSALAAVVGQDGTCRPQMVDASYGHYYELLTAMKEKIGVGAVLNTSFNLHGEPMVATPADAISTFVRSGADALVIGDRLVLPPHSGASS